MKKKLAYKWLGVVLGATLAAATLAGCGSQTENGSGEVGTAASEASEDVAGEQEDAEGAQDAQEASEAQDGDVADDGEVRILQLGQELNRRWTNDEISAVVSYNVPLLSEEDAARYPELQEAFEQCGAAEQAAALESLSELSDLATQDDTTEDMLMSYSDEKTMVIRRADTNVVSLYESDFYFGGGAHGYYGYESHTFDVATGAELSLSDVITDTDAFWDLVAERLEIQYRDIYEDFDAPEETIESFKAGQEVSWTLSDESITIFFDPETFTYYAAGPQIINIYFDENPELFVQEYTQVPEDYVIPILEGERFAVNIDGERMDIGIDEIIYDGAMFQYEVSLGTESVAIDEYAYSQESYVVRSGGKYYLYMHTDFEEGGNNNIVVDLQDMHVVGSVYGELGKITALYDTGEDVIDYYETSYPMLDPAAFWIGEPMMMLGSYAGYRQYAVGSEGLATTSDEIYETSMTYVLKTQRALSVDTVDESGAVTGTGEIPEGSYIKIFFTDDDTYVDVQLIDESLVEVEDFGDVSYYYDLAAITYDASEPLYRIPVERVDLSFSVDGLDEMEVFDGILYAN